MVTKNNAEKEKTIKIKLNGSKVSFMCKIEKSKFEKFRISKLSKKIQSNIEFLTNITITNCNLTDLPEAFGNLPIKKLNLSHNALKFVPDVLYISLYRIVDLDLSYNLIDEFLAPNCLLSLAILKINNNQLKVMPGWLWESSIRLKHLDISCNKFDMSSYGVMFKTFFSISRLKWLSLASCNFGNCDTAVLNRIPYLTYLDIGNDDSCNNYDKMYNNWDIPILQLDCKNNLRILRAQNLFLSAVPDNIDELRHLTAIYLSGNNLHWLPESFSLLNRLTVCDLSNNSLSYFPTNFQNLASLTELYLANNLLNDLPDCMDSFKQLHILDLYNNNLETIDPKLISRMSEIDVEHNCCSIKVEDYLRKKQKLRHRIGVSRLDGAKKLVRSESSDNCESCKDCTSSSYTLDETSNAAYDIAENVHYDCRKSETNSLEEYWDSNYLDENYIPLPPNIRNSNNLNGVSKTSTFPSLLQEQYDLFELFKDAD